MLVLWLPVISLAACAQHKENFTSPPGYDFQQPEIHYMMESLYEISGIAFDGGNPDLLYCEQDEKGKVFLWKPGNKDAASVSFGKDGDYEDIAIYGGYVIILRSDGTLFTFPLSQVKQGKVTMTRKWEGLLPKGEYESLFADPKDGRLVLLCKDSHKDRESGRVSGYTLSLGDDGALTRDRSFHFDPAPIARYTGGHPKEFKPSALTRDPATGYWYILSSVNKVLVVADPDWKVKQAFALDPTIFIQPEGIAFDSLRALYISNEGSKTQAATVLKFPYRKPD